MVRLHDIDSEGGQRRRHVDVLEGAGHGILAADGRNLQRVLCPKGAEQGREWLAPMRRVLAHALEILLEREADALRMAAQGDHFGRGGHDRIDRAMERTPGHAVRIETKGHGRRRIPLGMLHRDLRDHALGRRHLPATTKGHEHGVAADGRIETLGEPLLAADVEILEILQPGGAEVALLCRDLRRYLMQIAVLVVRLPDRGHDMLAHAVRIEEGTVHLHDGLPAPVHDEARLLRDHGDLRRLEVLSLRVLLEGLHILRVEHDGHALLRFGDRKLRAVEARILLLDGIEVDDEAVGQLADGHGHAARAEIVAALDHAADFRVAEQALDLALGRWIAFLHFSAAGMDGLLRMFLGRTRRAADAVAARAPAEQHDDIARLRTLTHDVDLRRRRDDRADLHAFGHVALVVDLAHLARGEADLVAVGAVARGRAQRDLLLRQLARQRLLEGTARVSGTGHAHGLIDVGTAGQRIADSTAEAGRRAAERLDFRRMVMRLVLEHDEPFLILAIHIDVHDDAAGVDFLGLVEILELALTAQRLHADDREVHERDLTLLAAVDVLAIGEILLVGRRERGGEIALLDVHHIDGRRERRVTAMVGPVGIDDAQLRNRRGAALRIAEIALAELQVLEAHRETALVHEGVQAGLVKRVEILQHRHVLRLLVGDIQRLRLLHGGLATLHRVDAVSLDFIEILVAHIAHDDDDTRRHDLRTLLLRHELHALGRRVRALVELPRQILHGKGTGVREVWQFLLIDDIYGRLREDDGFHLCILRIAEPLDIVAVDDAYRREPREPERLDEVVLQLLRRDIEKALTFLDENSSYCHAYLCLQNQWIYISLKIYINRHDCLFLTVMPVMIL